MKNFHELVPDMAHKVLRILLYLPERFVPLIVSCNSTRSNWIPSKRKQSITWRWEIRYSWLLTPPLAKLWWPSTRSHWLASI